jgi:hypothetical protein
MNLQQTTGSLDFTTKKEEEFFYFVEWAKVKNVEQMVLILQAMGFGISSKHVHFESIKEFLNLDYPVRTQ